MACVIGVQEQERCRLAIGKDRKIFPEKMRSGTV